LNLDEAQRAQGRAAKTVKNPSTKAASTCPFCACSLKEGEAGEKLDDYDSEGVDLTLIRWMLSLTPEERLLFLDKRINEIRAIQDLNGI
jgi:hypothetical protein